MKLTRSAITKFGLLAVLVVLPVVGWSQRWNLYDSWRLRDYQPSAQIEQLATDTTMNEKAKRLFYVYHPEINDKAAFNKNCTSSERTIVLGCYVSGIGIYVYGVTDERLTGVLQVTAAHEMLHAAYGRLSSSEKTRIDKLINEHYDTVTDMRIRDTIEDYRKNGADVTNELHSILGTEVRNLPTPLEDYYKRYFNNRLAIVEYSEKYEQAFTERKNKVAELDAQLTSLKQQIDDSEATLNNLSASLTSERARLEALLAAKEYEAYNAGVAGYNAKVNSYNAQVRRVRTLIDQYNSLVVQRNAIAVEEGELVKAIDSRPSTIETQ
jgi:hypothetical protein